MIIYIIQNAFYIFCLYFKDFSIIENSFIAIIKPLYAYHCAQEHLIKLRLVFRILFKIYKILKKKGRIFGIREASSIDLCPISWVIPSNYKNCKINSGITF